MRPAVRPFVLCVIDGWGIGPPGPGNALHLAKLPNWQRFQTQGLVAKVEASGEAVGLPRGQMGNSEVGHLNIGAGRIVFQDIVRIDRDIRTGAFAKNRALRGVMERTREGGRTLHLLGLTGPGGVHSHESHMVALLRLAREVGLQDVQVHAVLDGRDTSPQSAGPYLVRLEEALRETGVGKIATVQGRYWAMDRDQRWERTKKAWRALVEGEGHLAASAADALRDAYARGENDEFVTPAILTGARRVAPSEGFVFVNFRPDRARQLTRALAEPGFSSFPVKPLSLDYVCMTQYHADFPRFASVAYPPERPVMTLGEHVARLGLSQLRVAETEKYAHVTYFFSGGRETPFPKEERLLVASPKVATYDATPEMGTPEITARLVDVLRGPAPPDLVVLNLANPDMVGHTGVLPAAVRAVESVDAALGLLSDAALSVGGALLVTADHGNVESMLDGEGKPVTAHTTNPVPLVLLTPPGTLPAGCRLRDGILADIAPTILDLMALAVPVEMDRRSLLVRPSRAASAP